jgi:hypothetical protein
MRCSDDGFAVKKNGTAVKVCNYVYQTHWPTANGLGRRLAGNVVGIDGDTTAGVTWRCD